MPHLHVFLQRLIPFPPIRTLFNKQNAAGRNKLLADVNDLLLSGNPKIDNTGQVTFDALDKKLKAKVSKKIQELAKNADQAKEIETAIFGGLSTIRSRWSKLFSDVAVVEPKILKLLKLLFVPVPMRFLSTSN